MLYYNASMFVRASVCVLHVCCLPISTQVLCSHQFVWVMHVRTNCWLSVMFVREPQLIVLKQVCLIPELKYLLLWTLDMCCEVYPNEFVKMWCDESYHIVDVEVADGSIHNECRCWIFMRHLNVCIEHHIYLGDTPKHRTYDGGFDVDHLKSCGFDNEPDVDTSSRIWWFYSMSKNTSRLLQWNLYLWGFNIWSSLLCICELQIKKTLVFHAFCCDIANCVLSCT